MKRFTHRHQPLPVFRAIPVAGLGACLAVLILAALSEFGNLPMLAAPFGATCVLLFTAHASPLSQPINVVGGNLVAAAVGMLCQWIWPGSFVMDGVAVGFAIMAMMALRVVHPPAGALALVAYTSAKSWMFLLFPVFVGSVVLVGLAMVYHQVTQGQYPLSPPRKKT